MRPGAKRRKLSSSMVLPGRSGRKEQTGAERVRLADTEAPDKPEALTHCARDVPSLTHCDLQRQAAP